ncbi:oxalate decarboxylase OxdD-like [Pyxicephalus adspersus]|uniref:oxalate decarboxylase OxdD-like n=1 Tax=Pyxicephalus adspersus TaxID=30357 RepID=UPI003B5BFD99
MDNRAFEMQEDGVAHSSANKHQHYRHHYECGQEKKRPMSLMRIFLVCFLACLITTAIGVLVLSLVYLVHFNPKSSHQSNPAPEMDKIPPQTGGDGSSNITTESRVEPRFSFMSHLSKSKEFKFEGGTIQWARYRNNLKEYTDDNEKEFGMSINNHQSQMTVGTLRIVSKGLRAPHWHFNANEHGFLIQGKAWIGVVDDGNTVTTFNVTAGQVIFFPKNTLHWVKNVGDEDCLFLLFFTTHDELKTLDVDDAFFLTPEDIASRSLKPEGRVEFIRSFQKPKEDQAVNLPENLVELIQTADYVQSNDSDVWKYFYDLKGSKEYIFPGGIIQWARYRKNGAGLNNTEKIYSESVNMHSETLTLATLQITSNGLRQPHFHFNAHEMGYVVSGCGQIGIVGDKPVPDFNVGIGDVFFFPIGTQHYIKSICDEDLFMVLAFSTGKQLETLDMDDYFHATADHILAQLFLKKQEEFKKIPKFPEDQAVNLP